MPKKSGTEWKHGMGWFLNGIESELGPGSAMERTILRAFRDRLEHDKVGGRRKGFERDLESTLQTDLLLQQAAKRYLSKVVPRTMASAREPWIGPSAFSSSSINRKSRSSIDFAFPISYSRCIVPACAGRRDVFAFCSSSFNFRFAFSSRSLALSLPTACPPWRMAGAAKGHTPLLFPTTCHRFRRVSLNFLDRDTKSQNSN